MNLNNKEYLFNAKSCPQCEPCEVTSMDDASQNKRVFICTNPICLVGDQCENFYEVTFDGMQIPMVEGGYYGFE